MSITNDINTKVDGLTIQDAPTTTLTKKIKGEGNRLPFDTDKFSMVAFQRREIVLEDSLEERRSFGAHYHSYGKGVVKGGNLCFRMKTIQGQEMVELDFKINYVFRESLQQVIYQLSFTQWTRLFYSHKYTIGFQLGEIAGFTQQNIVCLNVKNQGSILVGNSRGSGLFNRVIVHFSKNSSLGQVKELLAHFNLADVLEPSSPDDLERMKIGYLFRLFFPKEATLIERTKEFYTLSIPKLKEHITRQVPPMQEVFENLLQTVQKYKPLKGRVRYRVQGIARQCSSLGAEVLVATVHGANEPDLFHKTVSILKMGMFSTEMRFANGMKIHGITSLSDLNKGSADSVFTQLLTKRSYDNGAVLHRMGYFGKGVTFIFDIRLLETVTYQYHNCRDGTRAHMNIYVNRPNVFNFIENQLNSPSDENEVMVKDYIPPSAIKGIIFPNEHLSTIFYRCLKNLGIIQGNNEEETIFNIPVEQFFKIFKGKASL